MSAIREVIDEARYGSSSHWRQKAEQADAELAAKDEEIRQWKLAAASLKERIERDAIRIAELEQFTAAKK